MSKLVRRITIIAAPIILVGAIMLSNSFAENKKETTTTPAATIPPPEVSVLTVENGNVTTTLDIQGELMAFDKINIFSEVAGTLKPLSKSFKVGTFFKKGELMLSIDKEEARLGLLAQKSTLLNSITLLMPDLKIDYPESFANWKKYLDEFDVKAPITDFPKPLNDQEKYFINVRNLLTQYYNIKSTEERLSKFNIYAPFGGVLTAVNTNQGALIAPGQNLGELMNTSIYELQATVPLSDLKYIKVGNSIELMSDGIPGTWKGRVKRIGDQIDRTTQAATVFIGVSGQNLREGMYLRGKGNGEKVSDAIKIPRNLLVNQNAVFSVKDGLLKLEKVEIVKIVREDAIVKGLANGAVILEEVVPGLSEGMKVNVQRSN
ncbi:efflux RND transporter periplasmic adaptor subunit [Saprospiraceae bacterium]|jgi:multidrug efflux pump subunit AcrA (membrane-fusion protein)|nr:efflux RND transporter periplasmic adaptor subunit [Bacteroidota bacterium]MDB4727676.1 efflux RND transporter periplasmic adaptor subunit [Saprospiraceae bacterium]MDF1868279.1 efflux RND transporter periplasmic adaptor subunit [Saprospiraceae bacterium]